jgi:hypothetical protein
VRPETFRRSTLSRRKWPISVMLAQGRIRSIMPSWLSTVAWSVEPFAFHQVTTELHNDDSWYFHRFAGRRQSRQQERRVSVMVTRIMNSSTSRLSPTDRAIGSLVVLAGMPGMKTSA